jgi:penicillin-insensitive murein DD-endopeptidase
VIRLIMHFASTLFALISVPSICLSAPSQCYGTVSNGRIERAVKLQVKGSNYTSYSSVGSTLGRTYVHSTVREIIELSFAQVRKELPETVFVYGETGWESGGRIRPHKTHQNGTSIDFFVPVKNSAGKSVPLPTSVGNQFGYDIEFDSNARYDQYSIDFDALAEHFYQLHVASKAKGNPIALVIFEAAYLPALFATKRGEYLRNHVPFMKGKPWVRHDEHYHVDFQVPCKPIAR